MTTIKSEVKLLSVTRVSATTTFADLPALLTVNEAALWLGMHPTHLYRVIADKAIPVSRAGVQRIRIRKEDLQKWLDESRINPS